MIARDFLLRGCPVDSLGISAKFGDRGSCSVGHPRQFPMNPEQRSPRTAAGAMKRAVGYGVLGGVLGMLAMDLVMVVEFLVARMPPTTYLELIGSVFGGGVAVGTLVHLVVGALPGLGLGLAAVKVRALHIDTPKRGLWLGFIIGVLSIPLGCVPFAIITGVPVMKLLAFSTIPHLVWGSVLGLVLGHGLASSASALE